MCNIESLYMRGPAVAATVPTLPGSPLLQTVCLVMAHHADIMDTILNLVAD